MRAFNSFRYQLKFIAQLLWLGLVFLLSAWWGRLLWIQAKKIAELEQIIGISENLSQNHWHKTQRMLIWESSTFFILVILCTIFIFWIYWRDSLRAKNVQTFFASVAHELRTPLSSIRLQAESIAEKVIENSSQNQLISRLIDDTVRMETQIEKTLELARLEGGGPVHIQPVQLKSFVNRFLSSFQRDFLIHSNLEQTIQFKNKVDDLIILADESALRVILRNLIENALRHSQKKHLEIYIHTKISKQQIIFSFQDNGLGYSGSLRSIGKIFQRGPRSTGTGIGLYLIESLMKKMNGSVKFFENVGEGFQVELFFARGAQEGDFDE